MDKNPRDERCLTDEELRELKTNWTAMKGQLQPIDEMIDRGEEVDCSDLHDAFVRLADVFDDVERVVMRAQQIRLLRPLER